jgi:hypothetical protein
MNIVFEIVAIIGGIGFAYYVWKKNSAKETANIEELSDTRLIEEFVQSAETITRFYNRASRPPERNAAMAAYRKILVINRELQRRGLSIKLLEPLLRDDRDAVRVVAAMALSRPDDNRGIKILKDVAERPELNPSNVVMLARFFLENIEQQKNADEMLDDAKMSTSTMTL